MKYRLVSIDEELKACVALANKVPFDIDIVCGIPRHGMIAASIIAEHLGKPLTTPSSDLWFSARSSIRTYGQNPRILMVDDSLSTWNSMRAAQDEMRKRFPESEMIIAATYVNERDRDKVQYYVDYFRDGTIPMFFSQFMHDAWLRPVGYDMDGVLCEDWRPDWDYCDFLENTKPYRIPTHTIDVIITGRLEKYRTQTEAWLKRYQVRYNDLIMLPEIEDHAVFKTRICNEMGIPLYMESSRDQAIYINRNSLNTNTVCYTTGELFQKEIE